MGQLSLHVQKLIDAMVRLFPGVGPKTAERYAFALLRQPAPQVLMFAQLLEQLHRAVVRCEVCFSFAGENPCSLCRNTGRDRSVICVVAHDVDIPAIEKSGVFRGVYHVLGGVLEPIEHIGPDALRVKELVERVVASGGGIQEVVFALPQDIAGEATIEYLTRVVPANVTISRLARGLPSGAEIEYADAMTLTDAFEGRRVLRKSS